MAGRKRPATSDAALAADPTEWRLHAEKFWLALGGKDGEGETPALPHGHEHEYGGPHRLTWAMAVALANFGRALGALAHRRGTVLRCAPLSFAAAARFLFPEHNFGLRLAGQPLAFGGRASLPLLDAIWPTKDGGWFVPSSLHPRGAAHWAKALGCAPTAASLRAAVAGEDGQQLEHLAWERGLAGARCQRAEEWRQSMQGRHLAALPLVSQTIFASAQVPALSAQDKSRPRRAPLSGVRVLCFGQVFAGPVAARLLAEQGAQVLYVSAPGAAPERAVWLEGHAGGRATALDLRCPRARQRLQRLLAEAHVCLDNLRPGTLEAAGVWPTTTKMPLPHRIGISAFGPGGPLAKAAGYDMTVQAASGVMASEGGTDKPAFVPSLLVADFLAAALAATAATRAVMQGLDDGHPRDAQVGLARALMALQDFGPRAPCEATWCGLPAMRAVRTPWGQLRRAAAVPAWRGEQGPAAPKGDEAHDDVPAVASSVAAWR